MYYFRDKLNFAHNSSVRGVSGGAGQRSVECLQQRVVARVTETAVEVIHVEAPHHPASKPVPLHPFHLNNTKQDECQLFHDDVLPTFTLLLYSLVTEA